MPTGIGDFRAIFMRRPSSLPFRITLCALLVLITTMLNLVRLGTSVSWAGVLQSYAPRPGAIYIGLSGAIWALAGGAILWGLWRRKPWALSALLAGSWLYAAWVWIDRVLLQGGGSSNWRFTLIWTSLLLGLMTAVALDPHNQRFFGKEAHERESQDPPSS